MTVDPKLMLAAKAGNAIAREILGYMPTIQGSLATGGDLVLRAEIGFHAQGPDGAPFIRISVEPPPPTVHLITLAIDANGQLALPLEASPQPVLTPEPPQQERIAAPVRRPAFAEE